MSGRVWGKVWDLNLYCFLDIKLQFVCLHSTLTASRPISHQCPHGVISDFEPFDRGTMDGPSFVWAGGVGPYPSDAPGLIIRTQTCTYTNTRWISPQKVALPDNSSFGEYLVTMATHTVAWPRGSMGNEWSPSAGGCVCLFCSGQISMSRVRVCHMEAACDRAELLAGVSALKGEKEQKQM